MEYSNLNTIACSAEHAVAIGAYGHLYVWGKNDYYISPKYKKNEDDLHLDDSSSDEIQISGKIGLLNNEFACLSEPTYFSLQHPLYKINSVQVACGLNFTAVIAKEKPNFVEELNEDETLFQYEIDDRAIDFPSLNYKEIPEEDYKNAMLSNKIRMEITEYLHHNKLDFMKYFKSRIIKESSFFNLMKNEIKLKVSDEEIHSFIKFKKMQLPGNDLILKPLYELIMKTHQGKGILYILGNTDILPREGLDHPSSHEVRNDSLKYSIVLLPPQVVPQKVTCGDFFILVLGQNGLVYSWAENPDASIGKNRSSSYNQIRVVSGLVTERIKIIDIACGYSHCLALTDNGIVMTWGEGEYGKLGNGRLDTCLRPEPISLDSKDPKMIKAYGHCSFCLMKDKTQYFWGDNTHKKFGTDYVRPFYLKSTLLNTESKSVMKDIAIGSSSIAFISENGYLYAIYEGAETQLSKKNKIIEGLEFYQVTCYDDSFFALSTKGSIFSWSYNKDSCILGREGEPGFIFELTGCSQQFPVKEEEIESKAESNIKKSSKVTHCFCAEENTILLTDKGEVLITGGNEYGQMGIAFGDIESFDSNLPDVFEEFVIIPRLSMAFRMKIDDIATGFHHVIAITNGLIYTWGANSSGQLGRGFFSHSEKFPEMVKTPDKYKFVKAAAGLNHSMLLTHNGNVFVFGSAENGKLGLGKLASSISICEPKQVHGLNEIVHISCSVGHSLAVTKNKRLMIWGDNWNGQLGNGNKENLYEPRELLGFTEWLKGACGVNHTVGISSENKTYHWGQVNLKGEEAELLSPVLVKGLEDIPVKEVYASDGYSVALVASEASIYTWGKQLHSRLASTKSDILSGEIIKLSNFIIPNERIQSCSIADLHGCIVTDQNSVFTWGYAANGRLGTPHSTINENNEKHPVSKNLDLSKYFGAMNKDSEDVGEVINDLQLLLQNEPEELSENNIKEVDKQITFKFAECIDAFIKITSNDEVVSRFLDNVQYKMMMRLQQPPIGCELIENQTENEMKEKYLWYGSMLTTYNIHPCYVYKLLFEVKMKNELRLDYLNFIYSDLENNDRLIFTCIYLSQMILKTVLEDPAIESIEKVFTTKDGELYHNLVVKMIKSSSKDMDIMRNLARDLLLNLSNLVNQDDCGIDIDPISASKSGNVGNKLSAYQNNRVTMERRMGKLRNLLADFSKSFGKLKPTEDNLTAKTKVFSPIISIIIRDFLLKCSEKFSLKLAKLDTQLEQSRTISNLILNMIFSPFYEVILNPNDFYVVIENKVSCSERNLTSLCEAVKGLISGEEIGEKARWLTDVNSFITKDHETIRRKVEILEYLYNRKFELEEHYLLNMFKESLAQFDKIITVHARTMVKLHSLTEKNLNILRVNNPSYDPLIYICSELGPAPSFKIFSQNEFLNLTLFTRSLRQDQSIVRCPQCGMLIPRDMAPSDYKQVIEIYDPMPPNSPVFLFTKVLGSACKKLASSRFDDYLKAYETRCLKYLKDYKAVESVRYLLNLIDTNTAAINMIPIETTDDLQLHFIEKEREIELKKIEKRCEYEYNRRKHHKKLQERLTNIFNKLLEMLRLYQQGVFFTEERKKNLMFNIEYGGCNRDLELFSDSVMFGIFLNKIRDYTMKKDMSINLFESLKDEMSDSLRGFMKRNLNELKGKKCFVGEPIIPPNIKVKNIIFTFEIDKGNLVIIVTDSPGKLNICGRDEYRHEEILIYTKVCADEISEMRERIKQGKEDGPKVLSDSNSSCVISFNKKKLLQIIGSIEDKIAAYHQNIRISKAEGNNEENTVSHRRDKSEMDSDRTANEKGL